MSVAKERSQRRREKMTNNNQTPYEKQFSKVSRVELRDKILKMFDELDRASKNLNKIMRGKK